MDKDYEIKEGDTIDILVDNKYKETLKIDLRQILPNLLIGKKVNYEKFMTLGLGAPRTVKIVKINPSSNKK